MFTLLARLLAALNSESSPRQIAFAIGLGMIVGLSPLLSLHNVVVLLLAFIIRVNLASFFVAVAGFSVLSLALASPMASLGESMLNNASLESLWTSLYQISLFKLAHFHHTLTLGALVTALLAFIPVVLFMVFFVQRYRHHLKSFVERFKIVQSLKASKFYQLYESWSN